MNRGIILILGGARSGKSLFAQQLASERGKQVLFVATGAPSDDEMRQRILLHKKARPKAWRTVEVSTSIAQAIREQRGNADMVIVDCLSMLVANLISPIHSSMEVEGVDYDAVEKELNNELEGIIALVEELTFQIIIVSNEVGMGLVPVYPVGRAYRDLLGRANQLIAHNADKVYLMVAGIPLKLKGD